MIWPYTGDICDAITFNKDSFFFNKFGSCTVYADWVLFNGLRRLAIKRLALKLIAIINNYRIAINFYDRYRLWRYPLFHFYGRLFNCHSFNAMHTICKCPYHSVIAPSLESISYSCKKDKKIKHAIKSWTLIMVFLTYHVRICI